MTHVSVRYRVCEITRVAAPQADSGEIVSVLLLPEGGEHKEGVDGSMKLEFDDVVAAAKLGLNKIFTVHFLPDGS